MSEYLTESKKTYKNMDTLLHYFGVGKMGLVQCITITY